MMTQTSERCARRYMPVLLALTLLAASGVFAQAQTPTPAPSAPEPTKP